MISHSIIKMLPEIFYISSSLILLLFGIIFNRKVINLLALCCTFTTLIILVLLIINNNNDEFFFFNSLLKVNLYIRSSQAFILTIGTLILLVLNLSKYNYEYEFSILILFTLFGMITLISVNNLIIFYLAFELMNIPLYVLANFNKNSVYSCEAGIKYFILGTLSSCILLYGISLLYGYTGQVNFSQLSSFLQNYQQLSYGIIFGLFFIFIGFCFKLAVAPFHMWIPDIYQGSPTIVTMFFSTAHKTTLIIFLIRLNTEIFTNIKNYIQPIFLYSSVFSVIVSSLGALKQKNLKRLFAYSSIGHVGFLFASLSIFNNDGINSSLIYLIIYIVISIGLFLYFIQIEDDYCNIESLSGIGWKKPILSFHLSVLLFSIAGIPPFAGFFAKLFIFKSLVKSNIVSLPLLFILVSVISCFYYLNIIKTMYFNKIIDNNKLSYNNKSLFFIISIISLNNIIFFIYVKDLYSLICLITKGLLK